MKKLLSLALFTLSPLIMLSQEHESTGKAIAKGFENYTEPIVNFVFYQIPLFEQPGTDEYVQVPVIVLILILAALFFTIYFKGVNLRYLKTWYKTISGQYDHLDHHIPANEDIKVEDGEIQDTIKIEGEVPGQITHFQALAASLSATIGLGNIAGVAVAIALGGPGAVIWMMVAGILGMASKFVECTLGVKYREVDETGETYGGPMYYLRSGLKEKGLAGLGKVLAVLFAIFCVFGSFGGGNMFQSNQAASQFMDMVGMEKTANHGLIVGIAMAVIVGLVIIGGIKRIGSITEKVVPFMAIMFVISCLIIIGVNYDMIPFSLRQIWKGAFNPNAAFGGIVGVLIVGFQRAAFSNEAGVGSAPIAHSAVKTRYPASEGITAVVGPFIDTVVVCLMTASVIIITNAKHNLFEYGNVSSDSTNVLLNGTGEKIGGVDLTSLAFDSAIPHFSILLTIAVILFAVSTMISWSYYGLQAWKFLFGKGKVSDTVYKVLFLLFLIIGSAASLDSVIAFSDAMIFAMVFPNVIGLVLLSPKVKKELKKYFSAIKISKMKEKVDEDNLQDVVDSQA